MEAVLAVLGLVLVCCVRGCWMGSAVLFMEASVAVSMDGGGIVTVSVSRLAFVTFSSLVSTLPILFTSPRFEVGIAVSNSDDCCGASVTPLCVSSLVVTELVAVMDVVASMLSLLTSNNDCCCGASVLSFCVSSLVDIEVVAVIGVVGSILSSSFASLLVLAEASVFSNKAPEGVAVGMDVVASIVSFVLSFALLLLLVEASVSTDEAATVAVVLLVSVTSEVRIGRSSAVALDSTSFGELVSSVSLFGILVSCNNGVVCALVLENSNSYDMSSRS